MANDDFYEFLKNAVGREDFVYKDQKVKYKFDPYEVHKSHDESFNFNRIFIKGECVNCQHYVCPKEDKVIEGSDDVVIYQGVLYPGCLKGHSIISKEKTRPCVGFDRLPGGGV